VSHTSITKKSIVHTNVWIVPWVANVFLKVITPFIDPQTREKLHFNEDVALYVPREQLWTELGGDVEFEYDHFVYWPTLNALCQERCNERKSRWEKAGKHIGESEIYLRGGDVPSVGQAARPQAPAEPKDSEAPAEPKKSEAPAEPNDSEAPAEPKATTAPAAPAPGVENQKPEAEATQA
jgi:hypothetical protein